MSAARTCVRCQRPLGEGLFCQYDGVFYLDPEGTVVMASRGERLFAWLLNALLFILTLGIGWIIWWFIVAPKGQNPGKAVVGLRVIHTNGTACGTGDMFIRGLAGFVCGLIPLYLDYLWILWDRDAQTLHDKLVGTVVVKATGSEKIVTSGSLGPMPAGYASPPAFAPPVSFPQSPPPAAAPAGETHEQALARLIDLRSKDLITEEEYQEKRKAILDKM